MEHAVLNALLASAQILSCYKDLVSKPCLTVNQEHPVPSKDVPKRFSIVVNRCLFCQVTYCDQLAMTRKPT